MKILSVFKSAILIASCIVGVLTSTAKADALDDCIRVLQSNSYTIKYENITPVKRSAMHEKLILTGGSSFVDPNPYTLYQPTTGIVSVRGADHYIETNSVMRMPDMSMASIVGGMFGRSRETAEREYEYASCRLTKDNEIFFFTRVTDKGKVTYTGRKKGKVEAVKVKRNVGISVGERFGDIETTRLLSALLPNDDKPEGTKIYQRVGSGTLADGRSYFDMKAVNPSDNVFFDAIRYYFDNGRLVKIEAGQYYRDQFGKIDGVRTIINVYEFSASADDKLFKLPDGLEDVTKRETDQKGAVKK